MDADLEEMSVQELRAELSRLRQQQAPEPLHQFEAQLPSALGVYVQVRLVSVQGPLLLVQRLDRPGREHTGEMAFINLQQVRASQRAGVELARQQDPGSQVELEFNPYEECSNAGGDSANTDRARDAAKSADLAE